MFLILSGVLAQSLAETERVVQEAMSPFGSPAPGLPGRVPGNDNSLIDDAIDADKQRGKRVRVSFIAEDW